MTEIDDRGCGHRDRGWICTARLGHAEGQHYYVQAVQPCPAGDGLADVCVHLHTDGQGPRLHCRSASLHNKILTKAAS